ncbi:ubiquitin-like protein [Delitschia confertaspora ATCC 74209]|uniref:Ubiquitin-like protein n=1 Tax=Delitschia confertaspora ATCC 74209 TaxID=1513339 RepID=A0A9P4JI96_9PLEO|nr:ubiquitin-like protein [Delitschia confertaspora ATCC 74209]
MKTILQPSSSEGPLIAPLPAADPEPLYRLEDVPNPAVGEGTETAQIRLKTDDNVQHTEASLSSEPEVSSDPSIAISPPGLQRSETEAIGPSTDAPAAKPDPSNGPVVIITLLLTASGARHPYKIDEKYLKKRNVNVENMDPYNISVYTLKELIWRDWREEWEPRPTSPSSIRLIHFGRMLDDKAPLKECRFQNEAPNVVHMTVKPQEIVDEEDAKTGKGGSRRDVEEEQHAGCRCVVM